MEEVLRQAGDRWVVRAGIVFEPVRPTLLPPWTGKVVKTLVLGEPCMEPVRGVFGVARSFKPARVTPLYRDGRSLYRTGREGSPLVAGPGEELYAEVSFVSSNPLAAHQVGSCMGRVPPPWEGLRYRVVGVEARRVSSLGADIGRGQRVRIELRTPTLLATKTPLPPVTWARRLSRLVPPAHRLVPSPGYILAAAARTLEGALLGEEAVLSPLSWRAYLLGEVGVAEEAFSLRAETVMYAGGRRGPRLVRGVRGWLLLRPLTRGVARMMEVLLPVAELLGIGRSRAIGFGAVRFSIE